MDYATLCSYVREEFWQTLKIPIIPWNCDGRNLSIEPYNATKCQIFKTEMWARGIETSIQAWVVSWNCFSVLLGMFLKLKLKHATHSLILSADELTPFSRISSVFMTSQKGKEKCFLEKEETEEREDHMEDEPFSFLKPQLSSNVFPSHMYTARKSLLKWYLIVFPHPAFQLILISKCCHLSYI